MCLNFHVLQLEYSQIVDIGAQALGEGLRKEGALLTLRCVALAVQRLAELSRAVGSGAIRLETMAPQHSAMA